MCSIPRHIACQDFLNIHALIEHICPVPWIVGISHSDGYIDVLIDEGMVENAARLGPIMRQHMQALKDKHPSVKTFRNIGLFGMVDLQQDEDGTPMAPYNGTHPAMGEFNGFLKENGLFTFCRWGSFMCNPPLCITEAQMAESFEIIDRGLAICDRVVTG